jgi:endonuclease/exonuclease/phosphatase family metal-dependent hydrolase
MALRVATWNIRKAVGLDRRRDPGRVLSVIAHLEADIVALQEADLRLGPRRAALPRTQLETETGMRVVDLADNDVSLGSHGNALLVAKGLEVRHAARIPLPGLEPRGAVIAEIEVPALGGAVHVVGTHLGLLRRWRRLQLATILDHLPEAAVEKGMILGDFNEWHAMRGLEALESGFSVLAPGRSFHAARPVAALDRIAHGPGLQPLSAGVERQGPARIASDHLPVWAEFGPR